MNLSTNLGTSKILKPPKGASFSFRPSWSSSGLKHIFLSMSSVPNITARPHTWHLETKKAIKIIEIWRVEINTSPKYLYLRYIKKMTWNTRKIHTKEKTRICVKKLYRVSTLKSCKHEFHSSNTFISWIHSSFSHFFDHLSS